MTSETELLKIKTKDDEVKELEYKIEKLEHEKTSKSLKIDNEEIDNED